MKKKCTKCKKIYEITEEECNPKTFIPYQYCSKCRKKNREEMKIKKDKIIEKKKLTNKSYCLRCRDEIKKDIKNKYCEKCKSYKKQHISEKRETVKRLNKEGDIKLCTRCCNQIEKEDIEKKFKTCKNCREIDKKSYSNVKQKNRLLN